MGKLLTALEKAGALFPTVKRGLIDPVTFDTLADYRQVVREDTNEVLGVVGSQFTVIDHLTAFEGVDAALPDLEAKLGPASVRAQVYRKRKRGTRNLLTGTVADVLIEFRNQPHGKQRLYPTLHLQHGIAGEASLSASAGIYRLICSNGMIVGERCLTRKLRHTLNMRRKLEGLEAVLVQAMERLASENRTLEEAQAIPVRDEDATRAFRFLLTGKAEKGEREVRNLDTLAESYLFAPGADPGNVNGLIQAATHYATYHAGRGTNTLNESVSTTANRIRRRAYALAHEAAANGGSLAGALLEIGA